MIRKQFLLDDDTAKAFDKLKLRFPFISEANLIRAAILCADVMDESTFIDFCLQTRGAKGRPSRELKKETQ